MSPKVILRITLFSLAGLGLLLSLFVFVPCFDLSASLCRGPRSEKWVALTFDDGPNEPYTSEILEVLKRYRVPATFFLVGKKVEQSPEVVRRILREGFGMGNHSWDHRSFVFMGPREVRREIERWEEIVGEMGSVSLRLFRAPHGWKTPFLAGVLGQKKYRLIGWSRGVWDSDQPGTEILFQRLTRHPTNGEIILLHDGDGDREGGDRSQTVAVLPRVIEFYQGLGFRFVDLATLLSLN